MAKLNQEFYTTDTKSKIMIEIPLEEYKELLVIKGKYEELKSQQTISWNPNKIT